MPTFLLTPLAWRAAQISLAAMAVYASRARTSGPKDAVHQQVLDDLPEGVAAHAHRAEAERGVHAAGRFRRVLRLGGAGLEFEAAGLGRLPPPPGLTRAAAVARRCGEEREGEGGREQGGGGGGTPSRGRGSGTPRGYARRRPGRRSGRAPARPSGVSTPCQVPRR